METPPTLPSRALGVESDAVDGWVRVFGETCGEELKSPEKLHAVSPNEIKSRKADFMKRISPSWRFDVN